MTDMNEDDVYEFSAKMVGREVVLTGPEHELVFLPPKMDSADESQRRVGLRVDGAEFRPAIGSFVTWDDDAQAELLVLEEVESEIHTAFINFVVTNDAIEVFDAIYAMIETSGELPDMDAATLAQHGGGN